MSGSFSDAFQPIKIRNLILKNRFIKTATYEGMSPGGVPNEDLINFHAEMAKGDVALTTVAYAAISEIGRTHENQLLLNQKSKQNLGKLVEAVHKQGGKASIQLTHCGFFSSNRNLSTRPVSPSRTLNLYGLFSGLIWSRQFNDSDLKKTLEDFVNAAVLVKDLGFDAIELHMGHGYLLSQFLSPLYNKRKDEYGGSLNNRMRFPIEVTEAVRNSVGDDLAILCKINLSDGLQNGFETEECSTTIDQLYPAGADAFILSGGITSKNAFYLLRGDVPRKEMAEVQDSAARRWSMKMFGKYFMKEYEFSENFFIREAVNVRNSSSAPLAYLGGVSSLDSVSEIMTNGFELLAVGRALIHDPYFVKKLSEEHDHVSPCNHCNLCLVEMDKEGLQCVL